MSRLPSARAALAVAGVSLLLACTPSPPTPTPPGPLSKPAAQVPEKVLTQVVAPSPPPGTIANATPASPGVAGGYPSPGTTGAAPTPREVPSGAYPKP